MTRPPRDMTLPFVLMVFLFVNVALVAVGWHIRRQRQAEDALAGLDLSPSANVPREARTRALAPAQEVSPPPPAAPAPPPAAPRLSGPPSSVVPESLGPAARPAPPPRPNVQDSVLRAAEKAYYGLKASPKFKDSRSLAAWKKEFLSHPDLAALDARYAKDRDLVRFLQGVARSKDFRGMLERHLRDADIQAFAKSLFVKPEVGAAARALSGDAPIAEVLKRLDVAALVSGGGTPTENAALRRTSESLRRSKQGAALKGVLEGTAPPSLDDRGKR